MKVLNKSYGIKIWNASSKRLEILNILIKGTELPCSESNIDHNLSLALGSATMMDVCQDVCQNDSEYERADYDDSCASVTVPFDFLKQCYGLTPDTPIEIVFSATEPSGSITLRIVVGHNEEYVYITDLRFDGSAPVVYKLR